MHLLPIAIHSAAFQGKSLFMPDSSGALTKSLFRNENADIIAVVKS